MTSDTILAETRFIQPENWRWHHFTNSAGYKIRFGTVSPKNPKAVVICLPGFREFGEKYFELAHDMLSRDFAFWTLDWVGQGGSDRLLPNKLKAHSLGFEQNIADLTQFILDYVKPASPKLPLILTGHSMGAHIGLRYLHDNPKTCIKAAAFSAPLVAIRQFAKYPLLFTKIVSQFFRLMPSQYIPGGDKMAELAREAAPGTGFYSSDPIRDILHKSWFDKSESLRVNGPTYKWLYETLRSCAILQKSSYLEKINTPVLIAIAGKDFVVSSSATATLVSHLPKGERLDLPEAQHEILMERDEIRDVFLAKLNEFVQRTALSGRID